MGKYSQLKTEFQVYRKLQGIPGIPEFYGYHNEGDYNILVIQVLGRSLERLFRHHHKKFSLATTINLGIQLVDVLHKFIDNTYRSISCTRINP